MSNVTPIRPEGPSRDTTFDEIHGRMMDELAGLRCVLATLRDADGVDQDDDLCSARITLNATLQRLHEV